MVNLLAIIKYVDLARVFEENTQFDSLKNFIDSVPPNSEIFDSTGYIGNLEKNVLDASNKQNQKNKRHFKIYNVQNRKDLDTEYFSSKLGAALIEIPDKLIINQYFTNFVKIKEEKIEEEIEEKIEEEIEEEKIEKTYLSIYVIRNKTKLHNHSSGSINKMIKDYDSLISTDPEKIIAEAYENDKDFRDKFIKKTIFRKKGLPPIYIVTGIETHNSKYLIGYKTQGPIAGNIDKDILTTFK